LLGPSIVGPKTVYFYVFRPYYSH